MLVNRVERGRYFDSVALMRAAQRVSALPGVEAASLMIGTPSNKALLRDAGLLAAEGDLATPNDLVIAVRGGGAQAAVEKALEFLVEKTQATSLAHARSLNGALESLPQANLAAPAAILMPPRRCARNSGSVKYSALCPIAV